jgi:hypothetical protein
MGNHHAGEIAIGIPRKGQVHRQVHARNRVGHGVLESVGSALLAVLVPGSADQGERQHYDERRS